MPAKIRVEARAPGRTGAWVHVRWGVACFFVSLPFAIFTSCVMGANDYPEHRSHIFSPAGFFLGTTLVYLVMAWRTGRLQLLFAEPVYTAPAMAQTPLESDEALDLTEGVFLGTSLADDRETPIRVFLDHETRNRHVYLIGKTRTGKTSVMKNMALQDMVAGHGLCFIDPHGDAAEDLAGVVPEARMGDVIYFDPTQLDAPAFNPFAQRFDAAKLAEDLVSVFARLVGDSWGPRLEHILRFSIMTLVADRRTPHTLADLKTLLLDEAHRGEVLAGIGNRQLLEFWALEFPSFPAAATAPILNKLSAFLAPMSDLERVFSRRRNDIDFAEIMDEGRILIVTLSKGALGDMPSKLLGGCLVACIQNAALARAKVAAHRRRDFYLYVDEFQNYTVSSFADILSESAKYRLNLTLAHQNLGQVPEYLRRAIFGNVGTLIAYQVSAQDAPVLAKEMHRSRLVVRERESNHPRTLDLFLGEKRHLYGQALQDPWLGMSRQEQLRFQSRYQLPSANPARAALKNQQATEELRRRRSHIERALAIFDAPMVDVGALKALFPDYDFKDVGDPTVEDFVNLPPHHGYVRIGTAENVRPLAPPVPKAPNPETQRRVMGREWGADAPLTSLETNPRNHAAAEDFIFGSYDEDETEAFSS